MSPGTSAPRPAGDEPVSVVVPCFNAARHVAATLACILAQTHRALEVLVVDDRSTDDSVAVVRGIAAADPRVRLLHMPQKAGRPAAPRNLGVREATSRWIAFCDADDLWHPRKLELQLQALRQEPGWMCSTRMDDFRDDALVRFGEIGRLRIEHVDLGMQLRKYRTPTSSILVWRDLVLRFPFDENPLHAREDTDCFIRLHEHMPHSLKLPLPLVRYRLHANQISGRKSRMVSRHLAMLQRYRLKDGRPLGWKAYWYTATHFAASLVLRKILHRL